MTTGTGFCHTTFFSSNWHIPASEVTMKKQPGVHIHHNPVITYSVHILPICRSGALDF